MDCSPPGSSVHSPGSKTSKVAIRVKWQELEWTTGPGVLSRTPEIIQFSRQENWSELPCPSPGDLSNPGIEPTSLMSPTLADAFFTTSATWEVCTPIYVTVTMQTSGLLPLFFECNPIFYLFSILSYSKLFVLFSSQFFLFPWFYQASPLSWV